MNSEISGLPPLIRARYPDFTKALYRRDYVISIIGIDLLESFEIWAFTKNPREMIYDSSIHFHWCNAHSTKGVSQDPDEAIQQIVMLWIDRFCSEAKEEWPLIEKMYK